MKHAIYALLAFCLMLSGCKRTISDLVVTMPGYEIEIYPESLGLMNWWSAKRKCEALGKGWRLPTKEELEEINKQIKSKGKGYFKKVDHGSCFWSITPAEEIGGEVFAAYLFCFDYGTASRMLVEDKNYVCAVREIQDYWYTAN